MPKPDFFIVGAPKCGTTSVYEYLRVHPDIYMPRKKKEPHFFGSDIDHLPIDVRDEAAYLALFADGAGKQRVGEASVWYLMSHQVAGEIKTFVPDARIMIMLRNPVDTLYSLYQQAVYVGAEPIPDFAAALDAEPDRQAGRRIPRTVRRRQSLFYTEIVRFAGQVQRYFDVFGRDAVHVIIFDDLKADAAATYRHTLEFLGVDPSFTPDFRAYNASKMVRSRTLHYSYSYLAKVGMHVLPRRGWDVFNKLVILPLRAANTYRARRLPMDPDLRRRLQTRFRPDVEQLSTLLDRDLTHWSET